MRRALSLAPIALSCLALSACVSAGGADVVKAIPSDVSANSFVSEIALNTTPQNVSPEFKTVFVAKVSDKLKGCAKGSRPLKLVVDLTEFKKANAAATVLVGSSNLIRGRAQLQEPSTGEVLADFDINRSVGGGGWATAIAMAQAEEQMSNAFGDEVCKQAFVRR